MPAQYPGALPDFTGMVGGQTDFMNAPRQDLWAQKASDEIAAIAAELGVNPSGPYATLLARVAAARQPRFKTGRWYYPHGTAFTDAYVPTVGVMFAHPMRFNGLKTFDQLGIKIFTGGSAGALIRAGVYADDGDGMPGALVADWGTIVATASGNFTWTINWTPAADLYWIAGAVQGAPSTSPTIRSWQNINLEPMSAASLDDADWGHAFSQAGVAGALPTPFTTTPTPQPNAYGFMLRAA